MHSEVARTGADDRDHDAWLKRLASQLARSIVETIFDGEREDDADTDPDR